MLPDDIISEIISWTSPLDAAKLCVISKAFKAVADSDTVWKTFLPSNYEDIISRSTFHVSHHSIKDLFLKLSNSHLILDGGNLSLSIDKRSGKKSYIIGARQLEISWSETPWIWEFNPHINSRFSEVAQLCGISYFDIRGKIDKSLLRSSTNYAAYFVFQFRERNYGFGSIYAGIKMVNHETDEDVEKRAVEVNLHAAVDSQKQDGWGRNAPRMRADGWLEVDMGDFFNDKGDGGEVEARLMEIWCLAGKSGLVVEGIEFRPLNEHRTS